jgi:hypothetical protein
VLYEYSGQTSEKQIGLSFKQRRKRSWWPHSNPLIRENSVDSGPWRWNCWKSMALTVVGIDVGSDSVENQCRVNECPPAGTALSLVPILSEGYCPVDVFTLLTESCPMVLQVHTLDVNKYWDEASSAETIPASFIKPQVYTLFTVLKCNLVFVFRCFLHYHFHATCFGNSLSSSGVVPLTVSLQFC